MSYTTESKIIKPIRTLSNSNLAVGDIVTFDSGYVYPKDDTNYYSDMLNIQYLLPNYNIVRAVFKFSKTKFGIVWTKRSDVGEGFASDYIVSTDELWLTIFEIANKRFVRVTKHIKLENGSNWNFTYFKAVAVSDNIIVLVGEDSTNSKYLTAKAFNISGDTQAIEGQKFIIESHDPTNFDAICIDTNKLLVGWYYNSTKVCILNISETDLSITSGTIYSNTTGGTVSNSARSFVLTKLDTNKYLLVRYGGAKTVAHLVTDTSISDAVDVSGGVDADYMYFMSIISPNPNTAYVVGYRYTNDGSTSHQYISFLKINIDETNTITSVILYNQQPNTASKYGLGAVKLTEDTVALSYYDGNKLGFRVYRDESLLFNKNGYSLNYTNYFCCELLAPSTDTLVNVVKGYIQFLWESEEAKSDVKKYEVVEYNNLADLLIKEHKE